MKIGFILPGFSASEDDWCIPALLDLAKSLASYLDVELHLFPLRYPHHRTPYDLFGARVHPLGGADARGAGRVPLLSRAVRAVWNEHRRGPFDLLHAFWADEPGLVAVTCASLLRIPSIVSLAGGELADLPEIAYGGQLNTANRLMTQTAMRRAKHVTAGSRFLQDRAEQRLNKPVSRLPLGVDVTRFSPGDSRGAPSVSPRLLCVASLVPVKDHSTLLAAFAATREQAPDARLSLVGDGPLRGILERRAEELGLADNVTFYGDLPHDRLPTLYRSADLCILSSRFEAQGMVVLEAAACGTPTIGTRVGMIPEFIGDDAVDVVDLVGLAQQMLRLLQDRSRLCELGAQALSTVRSEFTLEVTTRRLVRLYLDTVAGDQCTHAHAV